MPIVFCAGYNSKVNGKVVEVAPNNDKVIDIRTCNFDNPEE